MRAHREQRDAGWEIVEIVRLAERSVERRVAVRGREDLSGARFHRAGDDDRGEAPD